MKFFVLDALGFLHNENLKDHKQFMPEVLSSFNFKLNTILKFFTLIYLLQSIGLYSAKLILIIYKYIWTFYTQKLNSSFIYFLKAFCSLQVFLEI